MHVGRAGSANAFYTVVSTDIYLCKQGTLSMAARQGRSKQGKGRGGHVTPKAVGLFNKVDEGVLPLRH
jgi:hypothetical protein